METVALERAGARVEIATLGAELRRWRDSAGRDWLWDGDAAWWNGRAPLLFPMVGRAMGDLIRLNGAAYPLPQHGFARRQPFSVVAAQAAKATLRLEDNEATRAVYPFAFRLDVEFALGDDALAIVATVSNPGETPLPFGFGYHPAFRWPLPGAKGPHRVAFEKPERAPIHRPVDGLLSRESYANPFANGPALIEPELFADGALVFTELASRRVAFGPAEGPSVEVAFPAMPHFGLWTKPGAPYLCLEPWQGYAAPEGFDDDFAARPGNVALAPGERRDFAMTITLRG